jgi:hypothetical protein
MRDVEEKDYGGQHHRGAYRMSVAGPKMPPTVKALGFRPRVHDGIPEPLAVKPAEQATESSAQYLFARETHLCNRPID